jgi:molybdopterin synthase sulfur carrier subunit
MIQLKYFGAIAEKTGSNEEEIPFLDISLKQLIDELNQKYHLDNLSFSVAVNQKIIDKKADYIIGKNDIIALLPPFAGG